MNEHVYKVIELAGSSAIGVEDAVQNAIAKASKSLSNLQWFQVTETRGDPTARSRTGRSCSKSDSL